MNHRSLGVKRAPPFPRPTRRQAGKTLQRGWHPLAAAAIAVISAAMLAGISAGPALAIKCDGPYQITSSGLVATPFCEDEYLARVARTYGIRVSGRAIRRNHFKKREICRFVGHDIRVQDICAGLREDSLIPPW